MPGISERLHPVVFYVRRTFYSKAADKAGDGVYNLGNKFDAGSGRLKSL